MQKILISALSNAMKGDKERFLEAGMDDYLVKPIEIDALDTLLSHYLNRQDTAGVEADKPQESLQNSKFSLDTVSRELHLSVKRLQPIIQGYLASVTTELGQLRDSIEENNRDLVYMYAHRIKGTTGNFRMEYAASIATNIEEVAFSGDIEELHTLTDTLEDALKQIDEALR